MRTRIAMAWARAARSCLCLLLLAAPGQPGRAGECAEPGRGLPPAPTSLRAAGPGRAGRRPAAPFLPRAARPGPFPLPSPSPPGLPGPGWLWGELRGAGSPLPSSGLAGEVGEPPPHCRSGAGPVCPPMRGAEGRGRPPGQRGCPPGQGVSPAGAARAGHGHRAGVTGVRRTTGEEGAEAGDAGPGPGPSLPKRSCVAGGAAEGPAGQQGLCLHPEVPARPVSWLSLSTRHSLQASREHRHLPPRPSQARLGSLLSSCSYWAGGNPRTRKPVNVRRGGQPGHGSPRNLCEQVLGTTV